MKNTLLFAMFIILFQGCRKYDTVINDYVPPAGPTVTDIDGNVYEVITIGNQTWMKENLQVTHFNNGDPILMVTDQSEWINQSSAAYCNYKNSNNIASLFGRLYNWHAINDKRRIAPEGWHIPTNEDWMELEFHYGGVLTAGPLKETGTRYWASPNVGATNESGFTALPGGSRLDSTGFNDNGTRGYWWTTGESFAHFGWFRTMSYDESTLKPAYTSKTTGLSIRCIKD